MRALIAKEWRENRALLLGFAAIAPVLSLGLKWLLADLREAAIAGASTLYFLPGMLGLFLFAVGSDLVAADVASGRISFLAALPVRPSRVWAAKALFLYGAGLGYLAYLLALEVALVPLFGGRAAELFGPGAGKQAVWLLYLATGGAATLFMSTLIDRGFAAAFAALLFLAGLLGGTAGLGWKVEVFGLLSGRGAMFRIAVVLVGVGLLAGSYVAFTRGRIHLGARARRVGLAFAAFLAVVLPPAAQAEVRIRSWMDPSPADTDVCLLVHGASPDGRFALVSALRRGEGPYGVRYGHRREFWSIPLAGGRVRELEDRRSYFAGFADEGHVVRLSRIEVAGGNPCEVVRAVDLETGEILATRPRPRTPPPPALVLPFSLPARTYAIARRAWGVVLVRHGRRRGEWKGELALLPGGERFPLPAPTEGWWSAFCLPEDPGDTILGYRLSRDRTVALVPIRWRAGTLGEPIAEGRGRGWTGPPGGRFSLVLFVDGARIVDRRDLSVRPVEGLRNVRSLCWARGSTLFLAVTGGGVVSGELSPSGEIRLRDDLFPGLHGLPAWFDGEIALLTGPEGASLTLVRKDGTRRRLLPRGD